MDGINQLIESIRRIIKKETNAYDTTATVRRIEGNTAWVHIPGGVDETPVKMTIAASEGDNVQVRVSGGKAFLVGNGSAPPTDDTTAKASKTIALRAQIAADDAKETAEAVEGIAASAQAAAARADEAATRAEGKADDAAIAAGDAQTSATNASEYAARALGNLSTVQSVAEALNWITAHGTMTNTQDLTPPETALNPSHVYFVIDENGDYEVGGTRYSVVTEPDVADIASYYVLSIDESLNNYVATHLAVDSEGLWIVPDSGGNKVLIATGSGSTYTTAGTYIIGKVNNVDTVLASFTASGVQIGETDKTHITIDRSAMSVLVGAGSSQKKLIAGLSNDPVTGLTTVKLTGLLDTTTVVDGVLYFALDHSGVIPSTFTSLTIDGTSIEPFTLTYDRYSVLIDRDTYVSYSGKPVEVVYETASPVPVLFFGSVNTELTIGANSVAFGRNSQAPGIQSLACGRYAIASGDTSIALGSTVHAGGPSSVAIGSSSKTGVGAKAAFAAGFSAEANGVASIALGTGVVASCAGEIVIGMHNDYTNDQVPQPGMLGQYAFIIGNGTADNARSNALTVDWLGNLIAAGNITDSDGNILADKITAAGDNASSISISNDVIFTASKTGWLVCTLTTNSGQTIAPYAALEAYKANGSPIGIISSGWGITTNGANLTVQGPVKSGGKYRVHGVRCSIASTRIFG